MLYKTSLRKLLSMLEKPQLPQTPPISVNNEGLPLFELNGDIYNSGVNCSSIVIRYIFDSKFSIQDGRLTYLGFDEITSDIYWRSRSDSQGNINVFQFTEINRKNLEVRLFDLRFSESEKDLQFLEGRIFLMELPTVPHRNLAIDLLKSYNGINAPTNLGEYEFSGYFDLMDKK